VPVTIGGSGYPAVILAKTFGCSESAFGVHGQRDSDSPTQSLHQEPLSFLTRFAMGRNQNIPQSLLARSTLSLYDALNE
jgi:hypothetical protein